MAVDSHSVVYITDPHDGCIQKFSLSGQFIGQFGSLGSGQGMMARPFGTAINNNDYIHVSEPALQRISIFTSKGKFVHCFWMCDKDEDSNNKKRVEAFALALDKYGDEIKMKTWMGKTDKKYSLVLTFDKFEACTHARQKRSSTSVIFL